MIYKNYWSCSKFANWIRGSDKPNSLSGLGWKNWRKESQKAHPFRFWLAEEFLSHAQDFVNWPMNRLYGIKYYLINRYVSRTHAMTSNLSRGQWHEFEERMLHSLFDELVNFVEIEQAHLYMIHDSEEREKYKVPWHARGWWRMRVWRCPEAGLDHLRWAASLTNDDNITPSHQAIAAQEQLVLYHWWKVIRPQRLDPYKASGWSDYCEQCADDGAFLIFHPKLPSEQKKVDDIMERMRVMEEQHDEEDESMLIRLIKIRQSLWT